MPCCDRSTMRTPCERCRQIDREAEQARFEGGAMGAGRQRPTRLRELFYCLPDALSRTSSDGSLHSTSHSRKPCHTFPSLTMPTTASTPLMLLRATQVCSKLKISKTTLYAKLDQNSKYYDQDFPRQIKIGTNSVGWVEHQVDQWILKKIAIA